MNDNNISLPSEKSGFDHFDSGMGSLFPMPGGLKENVEYYIGKSLRIDKSEGEAVYKILDEYAKQPPSNLPAIFDVLNCAEGCNVGTGCVHNKSIFKVNTTMDELRQSVINEDKRHYLEELYDTFDKTLRLDDFIRKYTPTPVRPISISQQDIEKAWGSLEKYTEEDKTFDCGACGCDTCYEMAVKIAKRINSSKNCLEKEHRNVKKEHDELKDNVQSFDTILADTIHIKDLTVEITSNIGDITEAITTYNRMVSEIEKIALQVNIISLNASIEAAKAGVHGKSFSVVAEEIRRLAQSSNNSAKQTKDASVKSNSAIESVNEMVGKITGSVQASYENIAEILNRTKELLSKSESSI